MPKRSSSEIKKDILYAVKEKPASYAELERKVNTGYRSIKLNVDELAMFGQVKVTRIKRNPANGKPSYSVSITKQGIESLKKK